MAYEVLRAACGFRECAREDQDRLARNRPG